MLATVSANNLCSYALADFKCPFCSDRICRFCMVSNESKKQLSSECETQNRTEDMHVRHLQTMHGSVGVEGKVYGIERRCPLMDLPHFEVTSFFSINIMHDVLKGIIPQMLKLLIISLARIVSVTQINKELANSAFGKNDIQNKPVSLPVHLNYANIFGRA